jgi:hypothetical protein
MWMLGAAFIFYAASHCKDGNEQAPEIGVTCLACLECAARNAQEYAEFGGPRP